MGEIINVKELLDRIPNFYHGFDVITGATQDVWNLKEKIKLLKKSLSTEDLLIYYLQKIEIEDYKFKNTNFEELYIRENPKKKVYFNGIYTKGFKEFKSSFYKRRNEYERKAKVLGDLIKYNKLADEYLDFRMNQGLSLKDSYRELQGTDIWRDGKLHRMLYSRKHNCGICKGWLRDDYVLHHQIYTDKELFNPNYTILIHDHCHRNVHGSDIKKCQFEGCNEVIKSWQKYCLIHWKYMKRRGLLK